MTPLLRTFSIAFFSLSVVVLFLIFKDNTLEVKHIKQIEEITMLTQLPGISLSTSFLENRVLYYEDHSNHFYLNMRPYRFTDFIYVK